MIELEDAGTDLALGFGRGGSAFTHQHARESICVALEKRGGAAQDGRALGRRQGVPLRLNANQVGDSAIDIGFGCDRRRADDLAGCFVQHIEHDVGGGGHAFTSAFDQSARTAARPSMSAWISLVPSMI